MNRNAIPMGFAFDVKQTRPVRRSARSSAVSGAPHISQFDGYTDAGASGAKVLRDVFATGDAWYRTGDVMRKDAAGFFYFVDRVGDTFRWKGENVSTAQVAQAICGCPGVRQAVVYGVAVPGTDGKAGMAMMVVDPTFDLMAFRQHLAATLAVLCQPGVRADWRVAGNDRHV